MELSVKYYAALACSAGSSCEECEKCEKSRAALRAQIEFYFSDENLPGDDFLFRKTMRQDPLAPVALRTLGTFNKVKSLMRASYGFKPSSPWYILEISFAMASSDFLTLTPCGTKIARVRSMDVTTDEERRARTVRATRLSPSETIATVGTMFARAGAVNIVRQPQGGSGEFLIEYAHRAGALKAVDMFDQSSDWRCGRRVAVLGKSKAAKRPKKKEKRASATGVVHSVRSTFGFIRPQRRSRGRGKHLFFSFDSVVGDSKSLRVGDVVTYASVEDKATGERNAIDVELVERRSDRPNPVPVRLESRRTPSLFVQARGPLEDGSRGFTAETWRRL